MKTVWIIFRKEILDTVRDRRTLLVTLLLPLIAFPLMINVTGKISASQKKKAEEKVLHIALLGQGYAEILRDSLLQRSDLLLRQDVVGDSVERFLQQERLDAAIIFAPDFDQKVNEMGKGAIQVFFKSGEDFDQTRRRIRVLLDAFEKQLLALRYQKLALDQKVGKVLAIEEHNVTTEQEKIGQTVGGFLPYVLVLFCFTGCFYPAIDLGAGEKERGTIETLLTAPATRLQILFGKFGVVALTGLLAAVISLLGLYVGVAQLGSGGGGEFGALVAVLEFKTLLLTFSLLLPVTIFFAATLLALSIYARSFKEAQSILSPLTFLIIIPVAIGLIPGMKLNVYTALIPMLNVSLATKEILAGTIAPLLYGEVVAALLLLGLGSLAISAWWFQREETIFRSG